MIIFVFLSALAIVIELLCGILLKTASDYLLTKWCRMNVFKYVWGQLKSPVPTGSYYEAQKAIVWQAHWQVMETTLQRYVFGLLNLPFSAYFWPQLLMLSVHYADSKFSLHRHFSPLEIKCKALKFLLI